MRTTIIVAVVLGFGGFLLAQLWQSPGGGQHQTWHAESANPIQMAPGWNPPPPPKQFLKNQPMKDEHLFRF